MQETKPTHNEHDKSAETPPKLTHIEPLLVDEKLQEYSVKSLTEVGLDNEQAGKVCQLDNQRAYNALQLAEIRDHVNQGHIAVMLDNNFKDKSQAQWVKIYKTVGGVKTLVARFDPRIKVLHIDHHLTSEEIGDSPFNREFNTELPASTTPLLITFFRGLHEGSLFTQEPENSQIMDTLRAAWDAHQFMPFVDHFDPDSTESAIAVLKASEENINNQYFDNQAETTLDADHDGTYKHKDGSSNDREKLIKVLSDLKILSIPQTLRAIQVLENISDPNQFTEALNQAGLQRAAELYVNFEQKLQATEIVAQTMSSHYDGQSNLLFNILPDGAELDMAFLASILKRMHPEKIGPNGFEYCLIVRDGGKVEDAHFSDAHEYGVWLRTLHEAADLNASGDLLELLGIFGRGTARGNRNATTFVTKQGLTLTLGGNIGALSELTAGSKWRAQNPRGLIKTIEMIFDRKRFVHEIENFIGSRPDSILRKKKIAGKEPGTEQERGVVIDTIGSGERGGEQRVIKYLLYPPTEPPNKQFLSEVQVAAVVADLLWKNGVQLVLIPETRELHIKPGFIGAEFEKVDMITNAAQNEMGMPVVVGGENVFPPINNYAESMLAHLEDMRQVPREILDAGKVPVMTEAQYKEQVKTLLAALPPGLIGAELAANIEQLEFHFDQNDRVLVNGRTKPENMFVRENRLGQTDWESIKQGHHFEDQVSLVSNILMMNPREVQRYAAGMDTKNPEVAFLFVLRALSALQYNWEKVQRLETEGDTHEAEITKQKILIHLEIIKWSLSEDKNLGELERLSLEMRKLMFRYRAKSARRLSQLYSFSLEELLPE